MQRETKCSAISIAADDAPASQWCNAKRVTGILVFIAAGNIQADVVIIVIIPVNLAVGAGIEGNIIGADNIEIFGSAQ